MDGRASRRTLAAALVVALLVAVGCGGDDDAAESAATDTDAAAVDHNAHQAADRGEEPASVNPTDRCDLGLNTAAFNEDATLVERLHEHSTAMQAGAVDFTVREWAEVFVNPDLGVTADGVAAAIEGSADQTKIILGGVIADTLEPDSWVPMTDPAQCAALADELQRAWDAAARYPTAADALADGYTAGSVYVAGKGAHFSKFDNILDGLAFDQPDMLMYDSLEPTSHLMGMSYFVISPDGVPDDEGFTGGSDRWHSHDTNCTNPEGVAIAPTECDAGRGTLQTGINGWMLHAWLVPGCESPWGVFSGTNPRLPVLAPTGTPIASGCNTGKTLADPLVLDTSGDGPTID